MANYCSNSFTYYGDDMDQLIYLFLKIQEGCSIAGSGDAKPLLSALGADPKDIDALDGRTTVFDLRLVTEDGGKKVVGVQIDAESAWSTCEDFALTLLQTILPGGGNIKMCYIAEEPGCEIFINTDEDRRFYKIVLNVDIRVPAEGIEDNYYYDDSGLGSAFDLIKHVSGYEVSSLEELKDPVILNKIEKGFKEKYPDNEEEYLSIHTYTLR